MAPRGFLLSQPNQGVSLRACFINCSLSTSGGIRQTGWSHRSSGSCLFSSSCPAAPSLSKMFVQAAAAWPGLVTSLRCHASVLFPFASSNRYMHPTVLIETNETGDWGWFYLVGINTVSHVDYSRRRCKHSWYVQMDFSISVCVLFVCACERERRWGKRESKQINVSALRLNRLLSLGGECQVGPP